VPAISFSLRLHGKIRPRKVISPVMAYVMAYGTGHSTPGEISAATW